MAPGTARRRHVDGASTTDAEATGTPTTGVSSTDTPTTGETGASGESTAGDDPGTIAVECEATPQDHAAECPEPCPITVDLEVACDDEDFGEFGLRVAPAPDTTWLVTASEQAALLFRADAVDAIPQGVLPVSFFDTRIDAALDPAGELHLVASGDFLLHVSEAGDWVPRMSPRR